MDSSPQAHLPRLPAEYYRGLAYIHWTLTLDDRPTGWLCEEFHLRWQLGLLHTCARYELVCPCYVLMPDHIHLVCLGCNEQGSDQRVAIEFLRRHVQPYLDSAKWQRQAHDNVLREHQRAHDAFVAVATYVLENPVRADLVQRWQEYPYVGCVVAGYPNLDVSSETYWSLFWRIYGRLVDGR